MPKFPKTIFVKHEGDSGEEYLIADKTADDMVNVGEKIKVGVYRLESVQTVEGVIKVHS